MKRYYKDEKCTVWVRTYFEANDDTEAKDKHDMYDTTEIIEWTIEAMNENDNDWRPVIEIYSIEWKQII